MHTSMPDTSDSGQAVGTFISPQIADRKAYMIESEAKTSACEQGVVLFALERKRPNLSMDWRAWWGVLSHFCEASGSWWSGTSKDTDRYILGAVVFSRKGCIRIVIVSWEWLRERKVSEREREKQTESQRVCAADDRGCICVCVKRVLRQERQVGLCRWAVDGFISLNQLLRGFPELWPQIHDWCLQLLIPPQNSNISLNESMS